MITLSKKELQDKYQNYQTRFSQMESKMMQPVFKELNLSIENFGKKSSYDIIFGASNDGNIVYAKKGKNVTPKLIKFIINELEVKKAKEEKAESAAKTTPAKKK